MWWLCFLQFCLVCAAASSFDKAARWPRWAVPTDVRLLRVLCDHGQGTGVWCLPHPSATHYCSFQLGAGGGGLNSFCVIYSEKPAFPSLKNCRELGKMHSSRVAKVPSCPGRAPVALVLGHCHVQAFRTSCMQDPVDSDPHCHWSWFWDLACPFSIVFHSQHKYFPQQVIII